jgi:membrane-associated phospholipid phosphatase
MVLRAVLPFRERPAQDLTPLFQTPYSGLGSVPHWTSTSAPSGHAAVFFAAGALIAW